MFSLASIVPDISMLLVIFVGLMRLAGRVTTPLLAAAVTANTVLWAMAVFFYWGRAGG